MYIYTHVCTQTIAYHPGYVPNLIGVIVYQEAIRSKSGRLLSHDGMKGQTSLYDPSRYSGFHVVKAYVKTMKNPWGHRQSHLFLQVMQLLIQHGADVKLRDSMGNSAADIISQRCHGEKSPWPLLSCSVQSFEVITFWG